MSSTTEARVAVITGGSSGIGLHAARAPVSYTHLTLPTILLV